MRIDITMVDEYGKQVKIGGWILEEAVTEENMQSIYEFLQSGLEQDRDDKFDIEEKEKEE